MTFRSSLVIALTFCLCTPALGGESSFKNWREMESKLVEKSIRRQWVPMRDGIRLDTNIFLPKHGEAPYPTVLIRSPYPDEKSLDRLATKSLYETFLKKGYALVFQNERGRYWSEGKSVYLARAKEDGYDTVDWLAKQEWSNGKIGTIGCSSSAENQLGLSVANHPAHAAAIAQAPGAGIGQIGPYSEQGNIYRGGALQLLFANWFNRWITYGLRGADQRPRFPSDMTQEDRVRVSKLFKLWPTHETPQDKPDFDYLAYYSHLPVGEINKDGALTDWDDLVKRLPGDPVWQETHFANEGDTFGVPMLWVFSWYDVGVAPNVALFKHARENAGKRAKGNQQMLIGPLEHCAFGDETEETKIGERELGDARYDYDQRYLEWFDHWLKGKKNQARKRPTVEYYQMGLNQWVAQDQFPAKDTRYIDLYLDGNGNANSLYGDGALSFAKPQQAAVDEFIYDPLHPVPTLGGGSCCMGNIKATGALDQADLEIRNDILVYTSEPLKEGLNVAGFVEVELYVGSDAKDTDFTVKLIDVSPDGKAYNLDDNIFRVRYREGYDKKVLLEKEEVYAIKFAPLITGNYFKPGHRVRIEVSSSNFPRYDRNLNTGGNNYDESKPVIARNKIYHSDKYPSKIRLPVSKTPR